RKRVRDRRRRLREDRGLPDAKTRKGGLVRPPVGDEVEESRGDERPRLERGERLDRRPHVPVVRELRDRPREDRDDDDQRNDVAEDLLPPERFPGSLGRVGRLHRATLLLAKRGRHGRAFVPPVSLDGVSVSNGAEQDSWCPAASCDAAIVSVEERGWFGPGDQGSCGLAGL